MQILIKSLIFIILLSGCKTYKAKYPYSLSDFNPELRIHLEKIVQNGGMCDIDNSGEIKSPEYYRYLFEKTSTGDLQKLINCEHPVLRAFAFSCLLYKKNVNIEQILLNHLDDTAIITNCEGEFGLTYSTVSDRLISSCRGDSVILKSILVETVITKHSYLYHAYAFIDEMEKPDEKYYPIIKNMANIAGSPFLYYDDLYIKKEIGLYALSKYKRKEDIPFIAEEISRRWRSFTGYYNYSFKIIEQNPDTAYFKIIEKFYRHISHNVTNQELQYGFYKSYYKLAEKYASFLGALISYKTKRSGEIINDIVKRKLYPLDFSGEFNYRSLIYTLLKENECAEYKNLIRLLEPEALKNKMGIVQLPPVDDTPYISEYDERYW